MNDEVKNPTIDENYDNLKAVITALTNDYEKFKQKKVKAAGQRVRASLLNTKKLCDILRKQVKDEITAIPIKHRNKSSDEDEDKPEDKSEDQPEDQPEDKPEEDKPEEKKEAHSFLKAFNEHVIIHLQNPQVTEPKRKRKANKPKVIKT